MLNPLGAVLLEMTPGPGKRCDNRFLRARIGICDRDLLPQKHWMLHRDPTGYVSTFDVFFEIETEKHPGQNGKGSGPDNGRGPRPGKQGPKPPPGAKPSSKEQYKPTGNTDTEMTAPPSKEQPAGNADNEMPDPNHPSKEHTTPATDPDKGKGIASCQDGRSDMTLQDDSDYSDDGGLLAHFQQYYGGTVTGTVPQSQGNTNHNQTHPPTPPAADAPMDRDVIPLSQRRPRQHQSLPPVHIRGSITSLSASSDSDEIPILQRWPRRNRSFTPHRHKSPASPGKTTKKRVGSSPRRVVRGRSTGAVPSHTLHSSLYTHPAFRSRSVSPRNHVGPSGTRQGLRSQNRWPTPNRPPSPTGASPDKPIILSDSSSDQQITTPVVPREHSSRQFHITRKSLRLQAQGGPVDILSKAKKRVRERGIGSSSNSGIPLVNSFPFRRLTLEQIVELFRVYRIQLGHSNQDQVDIIQAIRSLDRTHFERYVKDLLASTKSIESVVVATIQTFQDKEISLVNP